MSQTNIIEIARQSYHHGDLRQALLVAAKSIIAEAGIENLSLRKLAERAGVSRTAPYHHFSGKNDLLCAIAAQGFRRRHQSAVDTFDDTLMTQEQKFEEYICGYVRDVAYPCFQHQVEMVRSWQEAGLISGDNALRTSQVIWGTVHGIAKLLIDGIYTDAAQIEEVSQCAVKLFIRNNS